MGLDTALIGLLGLLVTALGTYLVAVRRFSGDIETSEAQALWDEAASQREDRRQEIAAANTRIASLETRVAELEKTNVELLRENLELMKRAKEE